MGQRFKTPAVIASEAKAGAPAPALNRNPLNVPSHSDGTKQSGFKKQIASSAFGLLAMTIIFPMSLWSNQTEQNAEALAMITARMKSLSQSLNGMPQPPALDQTIQLPEGIHLATQKENRNEKKS